MLEFGIKAFWLGILNSHDIISCSTATLSMTCESVQATATEFSEASDFQMASCPSTASARRAAPYGHIARGAREEGRRGGESVKGLIRPHINEW